MKQVKNNIKSMEDTNVRLKEFNDWNPGQGVIVANSDLSELPTFENNFSEIIHSKYHECICGRNSALIDEDLKNAMSKSIYKEYEFKEILDKIDEHVKNLSNDEKKKELTQIIQKYLSDKDEKKNYIKL